MAYASVTYTSASGTTFALTNSNGDPISYIRQSDIKVYVNTVLQTLTTDYTFNSAGTAIVLNSSVSGATVLLQRITDITDPTVVYTAGSTLTAQDLNNADNQIRYGLQEFQDSVDAGGGVPDGDKGDISVGGNGTIWTVDNGAVTEGKIASGAVTETKIGTGAVTSTKIANDTIVDADINSAAAITLSKLGTGALPTTITVASANIVDGTIVDADISGSAEIAVSKLADGTARQLLQTDAAGTGVEWASNIDIPGTLDVTGNTTLDGDLTVGGSFNVTSLNGGPLAGFRNVIINGNPTINQRGYVSGAATSGANQYTLDRWRVVTSGQNISFTDSANVRTVTAPAGGCEQVVEGASILSGTYTLNWTGTATATVDGNAVAKGGNVTLTGGTNATVRFSSGTFSLVQLEAGTVATPFERRSYGQELVLCERYYETTLPAGNAFGSYDSTVGGHYAITLNTGDFYSYGDIRYRTRKRTTPTITIRNTTTGSNGQLNTPGEIRNLSSSVDNPATVSSASDISYRLNTSSATANNAFGWHHELNAEL